MKIRQELPRGKRQFAALVSIVVFIAVWWLLTAPILPGAPGHTTVQVPEAVGVEIEALPLDGATPPPAELPFAHPLVPAYILPSPWAVVGSIAYLHTEQALVRSALISLWRITLSFALAGLVAVPLGLIMGTWPPLRTVIEPITGPLRYLPISAVIPLFLMWFGVGETMKIAFLFTGVIVYLLPMVIESVDSVEQVYLDTASTLGAKPVQIVFRVLLPGAWPGIFEACRVLYGVGWTYVILAEIINAEYGLGHLLMAARRQGHIEWVYALILIVLLLGMGVNYLFVIIGRKVFAWREVNI